MSLPRRVWRPPTHRIARLILLLALGACPAPSPTPPPAKVSTDPSESPREEPDGAELASLVITADLSGHLEPCGCVADMLGGLPRLAAAIEKTRAAQPTLYLDAGHSLGGKARSGAKGQVAEAGTEPGELAQPRLKAEAILDVLSRLKVHTHLSQQDQALAHKRPMAWKDSKLPLLLAPSPDSPSSPSLWGQVFSLGSFRIGVVALSNLGPGPTQGSGILDAATPQDRTRFASMIAAIDAMTPQPELRILLLAGGQRLAKQLIPIFAGHVDLIALSGLDTPDAGDHARVLEGQVPVLQLLSQGRGFARLTLHRPANTAGAASPVKTASKSPTPALQRLGSAQADPASLTRLAALNAKAHSASQAGDTPSAAFYQTQAARLQARIAIAHQASSWPTDRASYRIEFVALKRSLPEAPWAVSRIERLDQSVAKVNLDHSRRVSKVCLPRADGRHYVGAARCASCHPAATKFWNTTRHSHAWETLTQEHKEADLECVGCHLTGWQRDGGACQLHLVSKAFPGPPPGSATGVQCEACHGPGSAHLSDQSASSLRTKVGAGVCRSCHRGLHSPNFDPAVYRPKILGPGHGAP